MHALEETCDHIDRNDSPVSLKQVPNQFEVPSVGLPDHPQRTVYQNEVRTISIV